MDNNKKIKCAARHYGDQMTCKRCRLIWDINDTDPPECNDLAAATIKKIKAFLDE